MIPATHIQLRRFQSIPATIFFLVGFLLIYLDYAKATEEAPQGMKSELNWTDQKVLNILWRVHLVNPDFASLDKHHYGIPAVSDDGLRIFTGDSTGAVQSFDASNGRLLWRNLTGGPVDSELSVFRGTLYVGSSDGSLRAYRATDGETLWIYQSTDAMVGRPVIASDKLLMMTNKNSLVCVNALTGKWLWGYRRNIPIGQFQVKGVANPLISADRVYAGFSDGFLVVLSLEDGSVLSSKGFIDKSAARFMDMDTDPMLVADTLVVGSFSMGINGLDVNSLQPRFTYSAEGPSSMVYADEHLYFSTAQSSVVSFDTQLAKMSWTMVIKSGELSRPAIAGQWLLVSSAEHGLVVLDRATGKIVQIFYPGKGSNSAPIVKGDRIYWISNGETLYSISISQ